MRHLLFIILILLPYSLKAEVLNINGQSVDVLSIQYTPDKTKILGATLDKEVSLSFGENTFYFKYGAELKLVEASSGFYQVSLLIARLPVGPMRWVTQSKETFVLNCGSESAALGEWVQNMISFHKNLEYSRGCTLFEGRRYESSYLSLNLNKSSEFELHESSLLSYVESVSGYVNVLGQVVQLEDHKALSIHESGFFSFFYLKKGEFFKYSSDLGDIRVGQNVLMQTRPIQFYKNAKLKEGYAEWDDDLVLDVFIFDQSLKFEVSIGHLGFDELGRLDQFKLKKDMTFVLQKDQVVSLYDPALNQSVEIDFFKGLQIPFKKGLPVQIVYSAEGLAHLYQVPVWIEDKMYILQFTP